MDDERFMRVIAELLDADEDLHCSIALLAPIAMVKAKPRFCRASNKKRTSGWAGSAGSLI